jgi:TRAP-type C4-dicarboxylate transport system permease small subunit
MAEENTIVHVPFEIDDTQSALDGDEYGVKVQYFPGVFLAPRVQEIPKYEKAAFRVAYWSDWVSMGAMIFLLVMTFLDVILRALFNAPFTGTYDWTRYLMVLIATFGMPLCTMNDEHVSIDVLVRRFPDKVRQGLLWLNYAVVVFILYIFISQDWTQGVLNKATGQTSVGVPWPTYPFYYFIAIGFACMLAVVVVKIANLARGVK